jgi:hypothetical protein
LPRQEASAITSAANPVGGQSGRTSKLLGHTAPQRTRRQRR